MKHNPRKHPVDCPACQEAKERDGWYATREHFESK